MLALMAPAYPALIFDVSGEIFLLLEQKPDGTADDTHSNGNDAPDIVESDDGISVSNGDTNDGLSHAALNGITVVNGDATQTLGSNDEPTHSDTGAGPSEDASAALSQTPVRSGGRKAEAQVSFKHLSLASSFFEHMLEGKHAGMLAAQNREEATLDFTKDNFDAWQLLLNIIHGHTRKVPRELGLQRLSQVVLLIDKYELHEVAEVFTDMWFGHLLPTMPSHIEESLTNWILISFVLGKADEFAALTRTAIWETQFESQHQGIWIPEWVFSKPDCHGV